MTNHPIPETPLSKRVFERIATEKVTPRPYWEFVFKNYFFWGLGALAVLFGAFAFSATVFEIRNVDWRYGGVTHTNLFSFFLDAAPFLWVSALTLFILVGYFNIRRTNHGYRYSLLSIGVGAILMSVSLGGALYMVGFGGALERMSGDHLPFHQSVLTKERGWWLVPDRGLLGGEVQSVAEDAHSFVLRDFKGMLWNIEMNDLRTPDLVNVVRGGVVRVVGLPLGGEGLPMPSTATSSEFHACFVLPWEVPGDLPPRTPRFPFMIQALMTERAPMEPRSDLCTGIRPYQQLRAMVDTGN